MNTHTIAGITPMPTPVRFSGMTGSFGALTRRAS